MKDHIDEILFAAVLICFAVSFLSLLAFGMNIVSNQRLECYKQNPGHGEVCK